MGDYVALSAVKDVLLSSYDLRAGGRRIDFSEAFLNLRTGANNTGNIALSRVDFDDSWRGFADFLITFTSGTAFSATMTAEGNQVPVPIGSGDTTVLFTAQNPMSTPAFKTIYTIDPSYWTGTAQTTVPDTVLWRSNAILSNDMGEDIIEDASYFVDSAIYATQKVTPTNRQALLFTPATVPGPISKATKYMAAFLVYKIVNSTAKTTRALSETEAFGWLQDFKLLVLQYIQSLAFNGPGWVSRPGLVPMSSDDLLGVPTFASDTVELSAIVNFDEVLERIKKYEVSQNYIDYSFDGVSA